MDKVIEKKKGIAAAFTKRAVPYWMGCVVVLFIVWLLARDNHSVLRVNPQTLSMGTVTQGQFNDYIRVTGQVLPMTTIQISPLEGGVVETIVAEEGSRVKKGDVILILNNESLDLQILNAEADLAEKENMMSRAWKFVCLQLEVVSPPFTLLVLELNVAAPPGCKWN